MTAFSLRPIATQVNGPNVPACGRKYRRAVPALVWRSCHIRDPGSTSAVQIRAVASAFTIRTSAHQRGLALFDEFACRDQREDFDPLPFVQTLHRNHESIRELDGVTVAEHIDAGLDESSALFWTEAEIPLHFYRNVFQYQAGAGRGGPRALIFDLDLPNMILDLPNMIWTVNKFAASAVLLGIAFASAKGQTFAPTGSMTTARLQHTATLLQNGKVLIAGGMVSNSSGLASAELYDPVTGTFTPTENMTTRRREHTATLLPDGKVLIAGGDTGAPDYVPLASAEFFDPETETFTRTGDMNQARLGQSANLLATGKVLITGGVAGPSPQGPILADAELYDPATGTFTVAGAYATGGTVCDFCPPDVLLADGRVLFTQVQPAEIYDPSSGTFSVTGPMVSPSHTAATLLTNGNVLLSGGQSDFGSTELYDPSTGTFRSSSNMNVARAWHSSTLLPGGSVLIAGGETDNCGGSGCYFAGSVASAEIYDPAKALFTPTASMTTPRSGHTATVLRDGRVLITGGVYYGGIGIFYGALASAELYTCGCGPLGRQFFDPR